MGVETLRRFFSGKFHRFWPGNSFFCQFFVTFLWWRWPPTIGGSSWVTAVESCWVNFRVISPYLKNINWHQKIPGSPCKFIILHINWFLSFMGLLPKFPKGSQAPFSWQRVVTATTSREILHPTGWFMIGPQIGDPFECEFTSYPHHNWLVVSTHLKNISQIGSFPQVGMKIKNSLKPPPRQPRPSAF